MKAASDGAGRGPYFIEFAKRARTKTSKPLMLTGGFKTQAQAEEVVRSGTVDVVGLARALVLEPNRPNLWMEKPNVRAIVPKIPGCTGWRNNSLVYDAVNRNSR